MSRAASMARIASPPLSMNGRGGGPGMAAPMMGAPGQVRGGGLVGNAVYHVGYCMMGAVLCSGRGGAERATGATLRRPFFLFVVGGSQQSVGLGGFDRRERVVCMMYSIYIRSDICLCSWLFDKPWFLPCSGGYIGMAPALDVCHRTFSCLID